jgi:competence protein ComEA
MSTGWRNKANVLPRVRQVNHSHLQGVVPLIRAFCFVAYSSFPFSTFSYTQSPMLKKILAVVATLYAAACFAAVDVNKATAADLDGIKGIGPGISTKILDERKKGNFKDWTDLVDRVKGLGEGNAAKFSAEGLTVNGTAFKAAAAPAAAKKEEKKAEAKATAKSDAAKPVANPVSTPKK